MRSAAKILIIWICPGVDLIHDGRTKPPWPLKQKKEPRVLILLRRGQIGATIAALPAIRAVRRHFGPQAEIRLMYRSGSGIPTTPADLGLKGEEIDDFIPIPEGSLLSLIPALLVRLRRLKFDWAVSAEEPGVSRRLLRRTKFFLKVCGIPGLIGFQAAESKTRQVNPSRQPSSLKREALRRLENLAKDGVDISLESDFSSPLLLLSEPTRRPAREWLRAGRIRMERPLVAVCPGTREPANAWPIERFAEIGRRIIDLDLYELVVCGGPAERALGDRLIAGWGRGLNAAGAFPVLGSAAVLHECLFMIGLDTGTTHLAAAVGVPCVTLQGGRVHPGRWDPLGTGHIIVRYPVACGGCGLGTCCLSRHPCMRGITVELVWQAIEEIRTRLSRRGETTAA
jgi:ADP-heptose:LPS heptosyltransferase